MKKMKPVYLWGFVGIIPGFGILAGIILAIRGYFYTKDKFLVLIGFIAIVVSLISYLCLYNYLIHDKDIQRVFARESKTNINKLAMEIEFYKDQKGQFPGDLEKLLLFNRYANTLDVLQAYRSGKHPLYYYKNMEDKYLVFSAGLDGEPYTADDIYPDIVDNDKGNFSYILK